MRLLTLLLILSFSVKAQTIKIGSKSYNTSSGVINGDGNVLFTPKSYADYPVTASKSGKYNFVVNVLNPNNKAIYGYIYSTATATWSNAYIPTKSTFQNIPFSVTLNTSTPTVRLYFADSARVDNISYSFDTSSVMDLSALIGKINQLEIKVKELEVLTNENRADLATIPLLTFKGFEWTKDAIVNAPMQVTVNQRLSMKNDPIEPGLKVWQTDGKIPGEYRWSVKLNDWEFVYY